MKSGFFKRNYQDCWSYMKESKKYFAAIAILFVAAVLLGFFEPIFFIEAIRNLLKNLVDETKGMNFPQIFIFIFQNNLKTSFLGILLGFFLGAIPLFYAVTNGYIIGFVAAITAQVLGGSVLLRLLPHGVFELPALVIALGMGLRLGTFFFTARNKWKGLLAYLATGVIALMIFLFALVFLSFLGSFFQVSASQESLTKTPVFSAITVLLFTVYFFISLVIGMSILEPKDKNRVKENLKQNFAYSLKIFLFIILPLLLIAAFIEAGLIAFFE